MTTDHTMDEELLLKVAKNACIQCPKCNRQDSACPVCKGAWYVELTPHIEKLLQRVKVAEARNLALGAMLDSMAARLGLVKEIRRYTDALAVLAGQIPQPPPPPDCLFTWQMGSAGAAMEAAMTRDFAKEVLDGGEPAPKTRQWLIDSIIEAFREVVTDRDALRHVLRDIVHGVIGRKVDTSVQPHREEWWHLCGFIHGPTLESVMEQLLAGTDEDVKPKVAQLLACIRSALEE